MFGALFNVISWIISAIAHAWGHHEDNKEIQKQYE